WVVLPDDFPVGRDGLLQTMMDNQISPRRGIMASHLEPAYAWHPHRPLPVTERLTRQSVILPLFHTMTEDDQDRVVGVHRDAASVTTSAGCRRCSSSGQGASVGRPPKPSPPSTTASPPTSCSGSSTTTPMLRGPRWMASPW